MSDLIERLVMTPEQIADLCDEAVGEILRERDLVASLEKQLVSRNAAWEEAIQLNYDQTFGLNVDGFIIVVRRWIENKEGKM